MKMCIVFGSEAGTTRYVANIIKKYFVEQNHTVDLFDTGEQKGKPTLQGYDLVLFGSPTYNSGQLEPTIAQLLSTYEEDLSAYKVAVFSLGDSNYRHFCASAEILEQWVSQNGGKLIVPSLKIDGYPSNVEAIQQWAAQVLRA